MRRPGYTYILTNRWNTVLYVGVTSCLEKRLYEHKHRLIPGFTVKYNVHKLVYFECFAQIEEALHREKQLKGKSRSKKIALINGFNPGWKDLSI